MKVPLPIRWLRLVLTWSLSAPMLGSKMAWTIAWG